MRCALATPGQSIARVKFQGATPTKGRNTVSRKMCTCGSISTSITFSFVDQNSPTFFTQRGRGRSTTFPIFDLWIRFGDISDQSRKLSEIAQDFGRFFALPNFRGQAFQKLRPGYNPWPRARRLDKNL